MNATNDPIFGQPPSRTDSAGDVCWLECGERSMGASLTELSGMVWDLKGQVTVLEREPGFSVVQARLSSIAAVQLKGALALAGASFCPPDRSMPGEGVLIFILSGERLGEAR
ncbi:MAG: hypothetical protein AB7O04_08330 [Hyphomonadaceae bacterium]